MNGWGFGSRRGYIASSTLAISKSNLPTDNLERVFSGYSKVNGVGNSSSFGLAQPSFMQPLVSAEVQGRF